MFFQDLILDRGIRTTETGIKPELGLLTSAPLEWEMQICISAELSKLFGLFLLPDWLKCFFFFQAVGTQNLEIGFCEIQIKSLNPAEGGGQSWDGFASTHGCIREGFCSFLEDGKSPAKQHPIPVPTAEISKPSSAFHHFTSRIQLLLGISSEKEKLD